MDLIMVDQITAEERVGPIERNCKKCNKVFYPNKAQLDRGNGIYCGRKCSVSRWKAIHKKMFMKSE